MKRYLEIGNFTFTIHKSKYATLERLYRYHGRTLYDCYERPSESKKYIYEQWVDWSIENNIEYFGVKAYSSNFFSLQGLAVVEGVTYLLDITPYNNRAYIIS